MFDWTLVFRRYNTVMKIVFLGETVGLPFCNSTLEKKPPRPRHDDFSLHAPHLLVSLLPTATSFSILYLMRGHKVVKVTYDKEQDTFRYLFLVLPCILLAIVLHSAWTPFEVCKQQLYGCAGSRLLSYACRGCRPVPAAVVSSILSRYCPQNTRHNCRWRSPSACHCGWYCAAFLGFVLALSPPLSQVDRTFSI